MSEIKIVPIAKINTLSVADETQPGVKAGVFADPAGVLPAVGGKAGEKGGADRAEASVAARIAALRTQLNAGALSTEAMQGVIARSLKDEDGNGEA